MSRRTLPGVRQRTFPETDAAADRQYSIGDLSAEFGITTRAIRFYEARGLISPERRGVNRIYSRRDRARLILILRGKNLGFTLEDVADYLALYDSDPGQLAQTKLLLDKVGRSIDDLNRKRGDLDRTLKDLKEIKVRCVEHLRANEGKTES